MFSRRHRLLKIFLGIVIGLIACICLLIALLPSVVSTEWGRVRLIQAINARIPGNVSAHRISFNWFGSQKVEEFTLLDPEGGTVVTFDTFVTETPLYKLLRDRLVTDTTSITSLSATLTQESSGKTNLQESLGHDFPTFYLPGLHSIAFTNVHAELRIPSMANGLALKASGLTRQGNVSGKFDIDLQVGDKEIQWVSDVTRFPVDILDVIVSAYQPKMGGLIRSLLGETADVSIHETLKDDALTVSIHAYTPTLSAAFKGSISDGIFTLNSPSTLRLTLTPEFLRNIKKNFADELEWFLFNSTDLELTFDQLRVPLSYFASGVNLEELKNLLVRADIRLPKVELINPKESHNKTTIKDLIVRVDTPENAKELSLHVEGYYAEQEKPIKFHLETKWDLPSSISRMIDRLGSPLELELALEDVSTSVVDTYFGTNGKVKNALGEQFTLRMHSSVKDPQTIRLMMHSEKVDIPKILLKVDSAFLFTDDFLNKDYSGEITIDHLTFNNSPENPSLHSLHIPWHIQKGFHRINASFSAKTQLRDSLQAGSFDGKLEVAHLKSSQKPTIHLNLTGKKMPSAFLELITGREEMALLFGKSLDIALDIDLQNMRGPVHADLTGEQGSLRLKSLVSNNTLKLVEPFTIEFQATPQIGKGVLSQFFPVFNELIAGENPIKLTISPDNFSLPLSPFEVSQMQIDSAVFEMGKLHFNHAGEVKKVVNLLRTVRSNQISVWTTPQYLSMENGILTLYRMDMLILDHYPLATWGKIDFVKDDVNMVVGLGGQTLAHAFEIEGLNKDMMLQIPVRGTLKNAKVDSSKATTRIGALLAQHKAGPEGLVIGTVLEFANGREPKVPPPTTKPLPWDNQEISEKADEKVEAHTPNILDPLKEIKKEASNILKDLFR